MGSHVIIDNFLDDYFSLREYCDNIPYNGHKNPVDGVFYPDVSVYVPEDTKLEVIKKLELGMNRKINLKFLFFRLSVKGVKAPHQAHTDDSMGQFSFMLYLNRLEDCIGGTSFVRHNYTGISEAPVNDKQLKAWQADHSNPEKWSVIDYCNMMENRACVFEANKMHRAEPVGGFGDDALNGRLVLTGFFDLD